MSEWYYVKAGERHGPVGEDMLKELLSLGQLPADTLVWKAGMEAWVAASTCLGLITPPATTPAPEIAPTTVQPVPIPPAEGALSVREIFQEALALFKADWLSFSLVALVFVAVIGVGAWIPLLGKLIPVLLGGVMVVGLWKGLLGKIDGKPLEVGCLFSALDHFVPATIVNLLVGLAIGIGMLLIIPGLILAALLQFWAALVVDKNIQEFEAVKLSLATTRPHLVNLVLLGLVSAAVMFGGSLCLGVGVIPALGLVFAISVVTYRKLVPKAT